jgi:hypothetical protein
MPIRKLENTNFLSLVTKIVLIAAVTAGGVFAVNKIIHKNSQDKNVLSAETKKVKETEKKIIENKAVNNFIQSAQTTAGDILGEATKVVGDAVSSAAARVEDLAIKTAVDKVMEQVDKMPEKEREKIKEERCK